MYDESVDDLLRELDVEIGSVVACNVEAVLRRIDFFQQDPGKLESAGRLSGYVRAVVRDFPLLDREAQLLRCRVFYGLCKVIKWKKVVLHLPTDVFLLSELLGDLRDREGSWYRPYMLLSWIYILTLSPFRFDGLYDEICAVMDRYRDVQILNPVIARIHAQLLCKNTGLISRAVEDMDSLTLNYLLKVLKPNDPVINGHVMERINSIGLKDEGLITLKVLPKLFRINAAHEEWEMAEDIISFYLSHLDSRFTDYRFALAHSLFKVLTALLADTEDSDTALQLVETCVNQATACFRETSPALVNHDSLHTSLLVIAEMSNVISVSWPHLLQVISTEIVPFASKFEQVRMNEIRGSQIKDASNYICWSLARSTRIPRVALPDDVARTFFLNLLMCSTFDRDLVVRRSANAALQEVLGRCFTTGDILDNEAIVKLIELPILNLTESYTENASKIYDVFTKKQHYAPYADFLLDWLLKNCLLETKDLSTAKLTIEALYSLLTNAPSAVPLIKPKLDDIIQSTSYDGPHVVARVLLLLITLETDMILTSHEMTVTSQIELFYRSILSSINTKCKTHEGNSEEHFRFMVIFKYWSFASNSQLGLKLKGNEIEVCFHMIKMSSGRNCELQNPFKNLIASLSNGSSTFSQPEDELNFWNSFEKFVRFNNSLACSAVPYLSPHRFQLIFSKLLPIIDCQRKADLLSALNDNLPQLVAALGDHILHTVVQLLNDYTVTQQGDVGRLVRIEAAKIIACHRDLFLCSQTSSVATKTISNLLRLSGEQVTDLRSVCFSTLCKAFNQKATIDEEYFNDRLLQFNHQVFKGKNTDFWKGYMIAGGAIHFTDSEIVDAIDAFLSYYDRLTKGEDRLELCNCLVRIIPSANEINELQKAPPRNVLGIMEQDIVKLTITYLNFWKRLFESGLVPEKEFNFNGFYAKIYNLNLIKGSSLLKSMTIQLLPYLASSHALALGQLDKTFTNRIINRLLLLAQREAFLRSEQSSTMRDLIQALAHIYLQSGSLDRLQILKEACSVNESIRGLPKAKLLL